MKRRRLSFHSPRDRSGFTLLETLVALVILSVSIMVALELFSQNLRALRVSEETSRAVLHARATMEEMLADEARPPSYQEGAYEDGFRWSCSAAPQPTAAETTRAPELIELEVEIRWPAGEGWKSVSMRTLKLQVPERKGS